MYRSDFPRLLARAADSDYATPRLRGALLALLALRRRSGRQQVQHLTPIESRLCNVLTKVFFGEAGATHRAEVVVQMILNGETTS